MICLKRQKSCRYDTLILPVKYPIADHFDTHLSKISPVKNLTCQKSHLSKISPVEYPIYIIKFIDTRALRIFPQPQLAQSEAVLGSVVDGTSN
jgi:hypothetical protein